MSQYQIFPSLTSIVTTFKGILLDAYGVFWAGNSCGLLPNSKETMKKCMSANKIVGILSNSTQLSSKETQKLQRHGLFQGKHFHFLITSGEIAKNIFDNKKLPFATPKKKFYLFGGIHPKFSSPLSLFEDSSYRETKNTSDADFIYISIPHINGEDQTDLNLFHEEVKKLKKTNLPMVCANPDLFAHEGNPPKAVVRQGCIAAMYEKLGGQVFYTGKPHSIVFAEAMNRFKKLDIAHRKDILMVGDTPETDIRGANNFGMSSALTTQTGIIADRISNKGLENSIQELPSNDKPNFLIERLGTP